MDAIFEILKSTFEYKQTIKSKHSNKKQTFEIKHSDEKSFEKTFLDPGSFPEQSWQQAGDDDDDDDDYEDIDDDDNYECNDDDRIKQ